MRRILGDILVLFGIVSGFGWASAAAAATLYGVTGDGGSAPETLYTLSQTDATRTFVRAFGNGDDGEVIAFNPDDGLLYHASGLGAQNDPVTGEILETFDPATLAVSNVPLSGSDYNELSALAYDDANDVLLAADLSNGFYAVTTGGAVSLIGGIDHDAKGLAFAGGALYTVDRDTDQLRTIDPLTGSTLSSAAITLAGDTVNGATGLALDPDSGILWALLKLDFQSGRELVTIDPLTGEATSIGNTGNNFAGIAFGTAPIPEPSTALLVALGLAALARRRTPAARRTR